MALVHRDRVKESSSTTGTGTYTLGGAATGFQAFSAIGDGNTCYYFATDGTSWEVGIGTYTASGTTLARTTILKSSNANAAVSWSAGAKTIVCGLPADKAVVLDASSNIVFPGTVTLNADPAAALQAATKQYVDALAVNVGKRQRVRVATTATITISTALNNGDSLDGVTLATGDLLLVKDQGTPAQNGVYVVGVSPARASEFDAYNEHPGSLISVAEGTAGADTIWLCTSNDGGTIDSTALAFSQFKPPIDITGLTENTTPDPTADMGVINDAGTGVNQKMKLSRYATGKKKIPVPNGAMIPATTNGAEFVTLELSSSKVMVRSLDFDPTTQEFAHFSLPMPKGWNEGTITFRVVWTHPATTTNFGVVWALQAIAFSDDDALDTAFGTEQLSTDTGGTTSDLYRSPESSAITVGGSPVAEDVVYFRIKRVPANGSDTMAVDAKLLWVEVFVTTDANTED